MPSVSYSVILDEAQPGSLQRCNLSRSITYHARTLTPTLTYSFASVIDECSEEGKNLLHAYKQRAVQAGIPVRVHSYTHTLSHTRTLEISSDEQILFIHLSLALIRRIMFTRFCGQVLETCEQRYTHTHIYIHAFLTHTLSHTHSRTLTQPYT